MKKINYATMKIAVLIYVLAISVFTGVLFAQQIDISGTFEGVRLQYDKYQNDFEKEFEYKYELSQKGEIVEGVSTIYNVDGYYAEVKLKGMVVGDKFHFEEYEIVDEMRESYTTWCYKKGVLNIVEKDGEIWLEGKTKSFSSNYGIACTGGYTKISKTDKNAVDREGKENIGTLDVMEVTLYPNPTVTQSVVTYTLTDKAKVELSLYDLNGRLIQEVVSEKQDGGTYSHTIDVKEESAGLYIVKLTVGKDVYSEQLIKLND